MGKPSGWRCWVPHCPNVRKRTRIPHSNYFRFPALDEERCRKWMKAVGYEDLVYLPKEILKYRYVCSEHFQSEDFNINKVHTLLFPSAVPSILPPGTKPLSDELVALWPPQRDCDAKQSSTQSEANTPDHIPAVIISTAKPSSSKRAQAATRKAEATAAPCNVSFAPANQRDEVMTSGRPNIQENAFKEVRVPPFPRALLDISSLLNSDPTEGEKVIGLILQRGSSVRAVPVNVEQETAVLAV